MFFITPKIYRTFVVLIACLLAFQERNDLYNEVSIRFISYNVSRIFLKEKTYTTVYNASSKQLNTEPDILVLVFQERLGLGSEWFIDSPKKWGFLDDNPNANIKGYDLIATKVDLQTELLVYRRKRKGSQIEITDIEVDSCIDRNIKYIVSSKGAVSITMTIGGITRVQFLGTHLHAFLGGVRQRKILLEKINKKLIANNPTHYRFMVGDLNYRLDRNVPELMKKTEAQIDEHYKPYEANEKLSKRNVEWFFEAYPQFKTTAPSKLLGIYEEFKWYDQLRMVIAKNYSLSGFRESQVGFQPTYKVDKHKDEYKTERTVSWTDRFIWREASGNMDKYLEHGAYEVLQNPPIATDHLPIVKELKIKMAAFKEAETNIIKLSISKKRVLFRIKLDKAKKKDIINRLPISRAKDDVSPQAYLVLRTKSKDVGHIKIKDLNRPLMITVDAIELYKALDNSFALLRVRLNLEIYQGDTHVYSELIGNSDVFLSRKFVEGHERVNTKVFSDKGKCPANLTVLTLMDSDDK